MTLINEYFFYNVIKIQNLVTEKYCTVYTLHANANFRGRNPVLWYTTVFYFLFEMKGCQKNY